MSLIYLQSATNCPGTNCPGRIIQVTNCPGTNCPDTEITSIKIINRLSPYLDRNISLPSLIWFRCHHLLHLTGRWVMQCYKIQGHVALVWMCHKKIKFLYTPKCNKVFPLCIYYSDLVNQLLDLLYTLVWLRALLLSNNAYKSWCELLYIDSTIRTSVSWNGMIWWAPPNEY